MSKLIEEWRPIKDYEGLYEVSDWGRVRSLDHVVNRKIGLVELLKLIIKVRC